TIAIGVRQGRAPRQLRPQMVEPCGVALDPADNLAQARRARELAVEHGEKLALARQSARPRIRPMRPRQPVEIVPRQMLQQLMKYAIVMAHGIDPPLVSGSFPNNPRPSGINAVRYVQQKMYRTAVPDSRQFRDKVAPLAGLGNQ